MINMLFVIIFFSVFTNAFSQSEIKIGNQVWMKKNLDVSTFRNGDIISAATDDEAWDELNNKKKPAWCYFEFDKKNGKKYGKLYNWYAVNDPRGLAPKGWHVPTKDEWTVLIDYTNANFVLQDTSSQHPEGLGISCKNCTSIDSLLYTPAGYGPAFKSRVGWEEWEGQDFEQEQGRDSTGFSALPGGFYMAYEGNGKRWQPGAFFWSNSEVYSGSDGAWKYNIDADYLMCSNSVEWYLRKGIEDIYSEDYKIDITKYKQIYNSYLKGAGSSKNWGVSVRCIKD